MQPLFVIRKSLFVSLISTVVALCVCTVFLLKEKTKFQHQARQLIIQNDSIMSANIVLMDSLKKRQRPLPRNVSKKPEANIYILHVTETVQALADSQNVGHFPVVTRTDVLHALARAYVGGLWTSLMNRFVISTSVARSVEGTYFYVNNLFFF